MAIILYSILIGDFLNSLLMNSDPCSYMVSIDQVYLVNPLVSTEFVIDIIILSSYCVILNHLFTGSIIVKTFISTFSLFNFILMTCVKFRYTESLFHGIYSASLADNLPYFSSNLFVHCQVSQFFTSSQSAFIMLGLYKYLRFISSFLSIPG